MDKNELNRVIRTHRAWLDEFIFLSKKTIESSSAKVQQEMFNACELEGWLASSDAKKWIEPDLYEAIHDLHIKLHLCAGELAQSMHGRNVGQCLQKINNIRAVSEQLVGLINEALPRADG